MFYGCSNFMKQALNDDPCTVCARRRRSVAGQRVNKLKSRRREYDKSLINRTGDIFSQSLSRLIKTKGTSEGMGTVDITERLTRERERAGHAIAVRR